MKKIMFLVSTLFIIACGGAKLMAPTESDVERGKKKIPDLTLVELNDGKADFEKYCAKCHNLKRPRSKTETQWRKIVPRMAAKAHKKAGRVVIDSTAQASILKYLVTMAKP